MALLLPVFVLSILLLLFILRRIQRRIRLIKLIDQHPGPVSIPILGTTWQFKWQIKELTLQMRAWAIEYHQKEAALVRFWIGPRPILVVFSVELARAVLECPSLLSKGPEYDVLHPWLGTGLLTSTGSKWRERRKMLTPAFHFNILRQFIDVFNVQSQILVDVLQSDERFHNKEVDLFPVMKRCALDIICESAMGCSVRSQRSPDAVYVESVSKLNEIAFLVQRMPWLRIPIIWQLSSTSSQFNYHLNLVKSFTQQVILQRKKEREREEEAPSNEKKRKAFLDLLLDIQSEFGLSDEDIREEVDTFMFEGHDTTAVAMGWAVWNVAYHPIVQERIQEELRRVFGNSNRPCTVEDLKELRYLEKVIKESLRKFPSVPNITRIVNEDTTLNGVVIPEGCTILVSPAVLHHNPRTYEDPEAFDPDRFDEEKVAARPAFSFIPFSAGQRNCIGQRFAMMEEKAVLSTFFRHFSVSPSRPLSDNIPCPEITNKPFIGFPLYIHSR